MIMFKIFRETSDSFTVHVTLDLGTTVRSEDAIRRLFENQMTIHQVGSEIVFKGDFTFRNFQGKNSKKADTQKSVAGKVFVFARDIEK